MISSRPAQQPARFTLGRRALLAIVVLTVVLGLPVGAQAAYRDVVGATPNLEAFWRLGDATGTVAADATGTQDGAYQGAPTLGVAGALTADADTGISITHAGDAFVATHNPAYANASTVEFWVRLNAYGDTTQYRAMASKGYDASQREWLVALGSNATGQLTYGFGSGGAAVGRRSVATLALNTWYLVDLVHPAGKVQLYLNGALDSELTTTATPATGTQPVILGDDGQTGAFANARYDELALYGRALTSTEIAAHYAAGTNPTAICAKVASPSGADTNAGTAASPYKTSAKLASALTTGQTGCLRTGTYTYDKLTLQTNGITLQTYPGDARATIAGSVWMKTNNITIQELKIDGSTSTQPTTVTINGTGDVVRNDDITNSAGICVNASTWSGLVATNYLIERNRVHNCGASTNYNHGLYLEGQGGTARDNVIYDSGDRGVQLYPDAYNILVERNTIDGNGEGVNFGGDGTTSSSNNVVRGNVISNATQRWLVESYFPASGPAPAGNTVTGNCLYATNASSYYNSDDGIDLSDPTAYSVSGNVAGDPLYANRAGKDFRLGTTSPCAGMGAPRDVAAP